MEQPCGTSRALARTLGVSPAAVAGYLKREDWPSRRQPPWSSDDVAKIRQWKAWLQEDRSGKAEEDQFGPNAKQRADVALKLYRARKLKLEAQLLEGKVIERELHELAMVALARLFVQAGEDCFERLPHQLAGETTTNAATCRNAWQELRERILAQADLELTRVDDEIHARLMNRRRSRGRKAS